MDIPQALTPTPEAEPIAQAAPIVQPQDTVKMYDISGHEPVLGEVPHDQVQDAISSGKYSLPQGGKLKAFSPEGNLGEVPNEQAEDAFKQGYKYATPEQVTAHQRQEKYSTTGQQVITGLEGAGEGAVGFLAPAIERGLGVDPKDILARKEINPNIHTAGQVAGFGAGMLLGTGEAKALTMAGEGMAKLAGVSSKVAQGATKMATEMALMQGSDEVSNLILDAPNSVGTAAANIGLSSILGAGMGGSFAGLGMGVAKLAEKTKVAEGVSEFMNRMKTRLTGADPAEAVKSEFSNLVKATDLANDEVWGATGLKAETIKSALPDMNPKMVTQFETVNNRVAEGIAELRKKGTSERLINNLSEDWNRAQAVLTSPEVTSSQAFDAMQSFKNDLWSYSKGKFGEDILPRYHEAYDLQSLTKNIGHEVRTALEDSKVWGKAADFQKELNSGFSNYNKALKDAKSKFMTKQMGEHVLDPAKFETYLRQNGKATNETTRQAVMGNFLEHSENYIGAINKAYEKLGVVNPNPLPSIGALKESLNKTSPYVKAADTLYGKLYESAGLGIGGTTGAILGERSGIPFGGIVGAMLGGQMGEKVIGAMLKPLMEKTANSEALMQTIKFAEASVKGDNNLKKSAANLFKSGYPIITNSMGSDKHLDKLDKQVSTLYNNPEAMIKTTGQLAHYAPGHATELASMSTTAVNYLHNLKPHDVPNGVLDTKQEPTKAQLAPYYRQLAIANDPNLVLQHIKDGTLIPQDIKTVQTISPAYYNKIQGELTKQIADMKSNDELIPYKTRIGLSMFMAHPLDSTMMPNSIIAAQSSFIKQQPQQNQAKPHKSAQSFEKSTKLYQTPNETAEADRAQRD